jgi:hypothetical protein
LGTKYSKTCAKEDGRRVNTCNYLERYKKINTKKGWGRQAIGIAHNTIVGGYKSVDQDVVGRQEDIGHKASKIDAALLFVRIEGRRKATLLRIRFASFKSEVWGGYAGEPLSSWWGLIPYFLIR